MLSAGDRAKGGFWRWTLSFVTICASFFAIVTVFILVLMLILDLETADRILDQGRLENEEEAVLSLLVLLFIIALFGPAVVLGLKVVRIPLGRLIAPRQPLQWRGLLLSAFSVCALLSCISFISVWSEGKQGKFAFEHLVQQGALYLPLFIGAIALQASAEELFFRGYLLQLAGRLTRSWWMIFIIVAGTFFVFHIPNPEFEIAPSFAAFNHGLLAFTLTALALITGRLEYSIGAHIGWNLAILVFRYKPESAPDLYMGFGSVEQFGSWTPDPMDWISAALKILVPFLICLVIHFNYVERRHIYSR